MEKLLKHCETYPKLQVRDVFKFIFQSEFGCEHLVKSPEAAAEYIKREYDELKPEGEIRIEALDGEYSRVHLCVLGEGLSAETLAHLFAASAKKEDGDVEEKLAIARQMTIEGLFPFSHEVFEAEAAKWKAEGYSAIHHSDAFREAYKPSYRVIANEFVPFIELFCELDKRLAKGRVTVALEGGSASGKTTLGALIKRIYDAEVFHMDDFFLQPHQRTPERFKEIGGNVDRERFLSEVLMPLSEGRKVRYRKFDCSSMTLGETVEAEEKRLTVVEGAYSMHPELAGYYDFSVFLDVDEEVQRARIMKRNSPDLAKRFFSEWIPLEQAYFDGTDIKNRCTMVIRIK